MKAVTWRYYRRGPDVYGAEPRNRYARVHLTDDQDPQSGSYLMCGRAVPEVRDVDEIIVGDDAYSRARECAACHRGR